MGYELPVTFSTTFQAALDVYFLSVSFMKLTSGKVPPERRQVYQTVGNTRDDVFGRIGKIYRQSI